MHEDITELMSLELDDQTTPTQKATLRAHLVSCAVCAETWEYWKATDRLLSDAPAAAPSADLLAGLGVRLAAYDTRRRRNRGIIIAALSAGSLLILMLLSTMSLYLGWPVLLSVTSTLLSALRPISEGIVWTLRGVVTFARSAGWQGLALGVGGYMAMAVALTILWVWLVGRTRQWPVRDVAAR
jgi:predicted anti-sigma-YlaC factor YlaD